MDYTTGSPCGHYFTCMVVVGTILRPEGPLPCSLPYSFSLPYFP